MREQRGSDGDARARTTVVIATRDRRDELLHTLDRLAALPERPPVTVVDNGSSDGTVATVREQRPGVDVIALDENRGAAARNAGVAAAHTPYVAFSDDDSWWEPGALARAQRALDDRPTLALVAARVLIGRERALDPTCAAMEASPLPRAPGLPGPSVLGFVACGAVVRRSAYMAVGGFDRRFGVGGEEELLALDLAAAGHELAYLPDVVARHHPSSGPRPQRLRHMVRNALLVAWLRRPLGGALRHSGRLLLRHGTSRYALLGAADALRAAPWVMRERRPVARWLGRELRTLD